MSNKIETVYEQLPGCSLETGEHVVSVEVEGHKFLSKNGVPLVIFLKALLSSWGVDRRKKIPDVVCIAGHFKNWPWGQLYSELDVDWVNNKVGVGEKCRGCSNYVELVDLEEYKSKRWRNLDIQANSTGGPFHAIPGIKDPVELAAFLKIYRYMQLSEVRCFNKVSGNKKEGKPVSICNAGTVYQARECNTCDFRKWCWDRKKED